MPGQEALWWPAALRFVTGSSAQAMGYDFNGNRSYRLTAAQADIYVYDAENRLVEVKRNGFTIAGFTYDGDGVRVKGMVNGVTSLYLGNSYEVTNGVQRKYYYAGNQRVAMRDNGALYWLLGDHLGSTAYTINGTTKTGEIRYYPWGVDRFSSGQTLTSYKFTGQREEAGLGLYYYGARWYDPALGRFIQPDTIVPNPGDVQSFDRYAYVNNNPLKYTDPTGHYSPEELMEHFGCENIECVLGQFKAGGDYDGLWGWFTILTQAQDGDQIYAHSIDQALDGRTQLDDELLGTFARVNGKIMIRLASTASTNYTTGQRNETLFGPDTLVAEKTGAVYGTLGIFGEYRLTGGRSVYSTSYDKSVNCSYDDCVSLALDGAADVVSAVAVGCTMAGQVGCAFIAGAAGKGLAVGSVAYTGYHTFVTGNSTGTDLTVTLTTSAVSVFAPPGAGLVAGEVQTLYDYNALKRKPE
ncbi:MAG: RHS repeat-associated core domain-containing protein [Caldilinea sp. CFX5]|nr:RHS repeat-associated core domain-containing protein [Caldilinea sp. CFX5]